ncbi:ATP-binding protein [Galbibacter sp. EGI 63066]|uniref:sensor histidine kinase n=1 Tax=Galbibacter sp. EGI 63066 TaxID=2993559 RepID=UPI00224996B0|nr:ATP-binding protein [Galbibacter sp. EGI 63066]MCX2681266.1 ATP-binding protein [Galbibacter sp. EGI 63066]
MILIVVTASVLIAGVTIYQYKEQAQDYHRADLDRKENQLNAQIDYILKKTTWEVKTENLKYIFNDVIYEISDVLNLNFNIYDLEGNLIRSSKPTIERDDLVYELDQSVIQGLASSSTRNYVERTKVAGERFRSSYSYILDPKFKPIGILNIPYFEDDTLYNTELKKFLLKLVAVYLLLLVLATMLAYVISRYITRSLKAISEKLDQTRLSKRNQKIYLDDPSEEIGALVNAYNGMIDELDKSAALLAKSEREQAWREMAKQVAHEIKNPLTPMRLSVQSFQRKFDPKSEDINKKVNEFSKTLIQQIDTMSNIASAFGSFASMPAQQNETLNVVEVVRLSVEIFNEDYIQFISDEEEIIVKMDRTQLIRVVTNLVKNATQAIPDDRDPKIVVNVYAEKDNVKISIADNGIGIALENHDKVFEPKFTTKTSGMGLGLGMVKNIVETYNGQVTMSSVEGKGTVFTISFPKFKDRDNTK